MSGPNGVFVLAPAFLAAYFLVALIAPTVCKALNRNGLIALTNRLETSPLVIVPRISA